MNRVAKKNIFEYLLMPDMEKLHSQMICWLLSKDCEVLSSNQKKGLISKLCGSELDINIEDVITEQNNIDITIICEKHLIIIENKLKSSQHSDQLEKYKQLSHDLANGKQVLYLFLTLSGEKAKTEGWINCTYRDIVKFLSENIYIENYKLQNNVEHLFVNEYFKFIQALTDTLEYFLENHSDFENVFYDKKIGKTKKLYKSKLYNEKQKFISKNGLETIFQKCYLSQIIEGLKASLSESYEIEMNETRGIAILDIYFKSPVLINNRSFKIGLEYQGDTFKFNVILAKGYNESNKNFLEEPLNVVKIFDGLSKEQMFKYTKFNPPKTRAYVSISKKCQFKIIKLSKVDLIEEILNEIRHLETLKNELIRRIEG
jgi:hypothetical protein